MGFWKKRAARSGPRRSARLWRQRFKNIGIVSACVLAIIAGGVHMWLNGSFSRFHEASSTRITTWGTKAGFRVDDVLVSGRKRVPQQDILRQTGLKRGMNIFSVDLAEVRARLESMAWIEKAEVSRILPGRIMINVTEREPFALWQYKKKISLIDRTGHVLDTGSIGIYGRLPLVVGEDAGTEAVGLVTLLRAEPEIAALAASAVRVGSRRWDLHLKNDVVVMLPEKDAELALALLARTEEKDRILGKNISAIDLRQPDRIVVRMLAKG